MGGQLHEHLAISHFGIAGKVNIHPKHGEILFYLLNRLAYDLGFCFINLNIK
jgi:hypothetical protein